MIPRTLHFIWIGSVFKKEYELGIASALLNTTLKVILHTDKDIVIPGVEIRIIQPPDIKTSCVAHLCDVIRLDILYKEGGIYSDLDVIWLRNPWEHLDKKVVIGFSNKGYKILCNAVMMSEPGNQNILDYKNYLISIFPCKKYWIPANPWPIWKDKDITFAERTDFFPIRYNKISSGTLDDCKNSIAVHLFCSMNDLKSSYDRIFGTIFEKS